jgi:hypothetical protein
MGARPVLRATRAFFFADLGFESLVAAPARAFFTRFCTGPVGAAFAGVLEIRYASRSFTPAIHAGGWPRAVHVFCVFGSRYFATPAVVGRRDRDI